MGVASVERVEDRHTAGLYLEMTDMPIGAYAREQVPAVLSRPAVQRATWWRNVRRDRHDLPRVLPEFDHLGVYEVGDEFHPAAPPPGVSAHHFRRYRRPGQGILTGRPTIGLSLVLISPEDPARAQELRDWADFVHIRHIAAAAVPGYTMITPYENATGADPRFLHFYEMDTDDPEHAFGNMTPLVMDRIGDTRTEAFRHWAFGPSLRIMYVNSFVARGRATRVSEQDLFSVVARQRACREFSPEAVTDAQLSAVLDAATRAPSAENRQPWEFIVVRDPTARATIGDLTRRAWEAHGRAFSQTRLSPQLLADVDRGATGGIAAAPVHVVVCADLERGLQATIGSSIFPAVQNLLLAATAVGLGSALTTLTTAFAAELTTLLRLPDHVVPVAVVPLGRPARPLGPPRREPFAEHTHREHYGRTWQS